MVRNRTYVLYHHEESGKYRFMAMAILSSSVAPKGNRALASPIQVNSINGEKNTTSQGVLVR